MKEGLKQPIPFEQVDPVSYSQLTRLTTILGQRNIGDKIKKVLIDEFGPKTVKERWQVLGDYGLIESRQRTALEGSAQEVATDFFSSAPSTVTRKICFFFNILVIWPILILLIPHSKKLPKSSYNRNYSCGRSDIFTN